MTTSQLTRSALLLAAMCILSQISIQLPISPVPMTMGTAGVYLCALLQKPRDCALTLGAYLLLGAMGLPVFAGFMGGVSRLAGPTGGYLASYIPAGMLASYGHISARRLDGRKQKAADASALLAAMVISHAMGSLWLAVSSHISFAAALGIGSLPYLPFEFVKIAGVLGVVYNLPGARYKH